MTSGEAGTLDIARRGPEAALAREWLETDGLGGFSSSTVSMANTRRYHAFFAPAVVPPLGRMVLWATSEERVVTDTREHHLSTHHYPGTIHPDGHLHLARFDARPLPRWTYRFPEGQLERELFLVHGLGDLFVSYRWEGSQTVELWIRPLLAFRDYHVLTAGMAGRSIVCGRPAADRYSFRLDDRDPTLFITSSNGLFVHTPDVYRDFVLPVETYRGLDDREDLLSPGEFAFNLEPGRRVWLRASIHEGKNGGYDAHREREIERRRGLTGAPTVVPALQELEVAADQFLVKREGRSTVIAGYPWFTDWGRDTMIALPGLTLATGRPELAAELILTFAGHLRDGLIPNRFPDEGETPEYNTVDATLWMAVALWKTWEATHDRKLLSTLHPVLREIRRRHETGTRHGIRVDADGLLAAGEEGVQLTWMDAKVEDWVVTPRRGKPVEIQALWYNFLRIGAEVERIFDGPADDWTRAADRVHDAFARAFWDAKRGWLADVIRPDGSVDDALRPNQLFALSLPFPLVDAAIAKPVIAAVRAKLLTPRGLRSLSPDHPDYHPTYGGTRRERDAAYHQGTVWGWLHGPYMDALLRFEGDAGRAEVLELLRGWEAHLVEGCIGQIAEIFDAEPPYTPRGCPAQAWSVSEVLRIARELA